MTRRIDDQVLLAPTTLTVGAGQCLAVRGQNGAGKTTLLRILAGQLLPSDGHGTYAGHTLDERSPFIREHVASLIGPPVHYTDLTLAEHLDLIWATWGTAPALRVGPAQRAALNRFGIDHLGRRFPHELSSGQSQMFHLASTFARPFSLLILDEPEQRLDPQRKDLLARAIEKARMDGAGIVLTSHDADLSTRLATSSTTLVSTQDLQ